MDAWPRCEEPLSTTQNTREADRYRLTLHDLVEQVVEWLDAGRWLAASKDPSLPHIPCRQVRQRAFALVFVFDSHGPARRWR